MIQCNLAISIFGVLLSISPESVMDDFQGKENTWHMAKEIY